MEKAMFEGSTARKLPIDQPTEQYRVLITKSGHINIKGPDGQTVIDQGVIDTDEIFASAATITETLIMGSGGEIINPSDTFRISGADIRSQSFPVMNSSNDVIANIVSSANDLIIQTVATGDDIIIRSPNNTVEIIGAAGVKLNTGAAGNITFDLPSDTVDFQNASLTGTTGSQSGWIQIQINGTTRRLRAYNP